MKYSISKFSELTQLGIHTLRYYEREEFLNPARDSNNRRVYSDTDVTWVNLINGSKILECL